MSIYKFLLLLLLCNGFSFGVFAKNTPIAIDTRIKTFIYSANEIFELPANYGYQSLIELSKGEIIKTIATGEAVSWSITPSENRIFIRPLEKSGKTNMTVITNKRSYMFDLIARDIKEEEASDLAYIVRFYYPEDNDDFDVEEAYLKPSSTIANEKPKKINKNYLVKGGNLSITPVSVFDNGYVTFFRLPTLRDIPTVYICNEKGERELVSTALYKDYLVMDSIVKDLNKKIVLQYRNDEVTVTNKNK